MSQYQLREISASYEHQIGDPSYDEMSDAVQTAVQTSTMESFLELCLHAEKEGLGEHILERAIETAIKENRLDFVLAFCRHYPETVQNSTEQFRLFDTRFKITGTLAIQLGCWELARQIVLNHYPCIPWLSILYHETVCLEASDTWQSLAPILDEWLKDLPLSTLQDDLTHTSEASAYQDTLAVLAEWCLNNSFPRLALVLSLAQNDWQRVDALKSQVDRDFLKKATNAAMRTALVKKSWGTATALLNHASVNDNAIRMLLDSRSSLLSDPQRLLTECRQSGLDDWAAFLMSVHRV